MPDAETVISELDPWIRSEWQDADVDHWEDHDRLIYVWGITSPDGDRPRLAVSRSCAEDHPATEIRQMLEHQQWKRVLMQAGDGRIMLKTSGALVPLPDE